MSRHRLARAPRAPGVIRTNQLPFLDRPGARIHFETLGAGDAVALLHGFASSFYPTWVDTGWVGSLLDDGFRVVGIDARGGEDVELETLAEDVVAVLDASWIVRAHLIGFTLGAGVAVRTALDHSRRVGAVVAIGPLAHPGLECGVVPVLAIEAGRDIGVLYDPRMRDRAVAFLRDHPLS